MTNLALAVFKRVLVLNLITVLLSSCTTHYIRVSQGTEPTADKSSLDVLKKKMKSCLVGYAVETDVKDKLQVYFIADKQHITYQSADTTLVDYMKICAGESYNSYDKDKGSISISGGRG